MRQKKEDFIYRIILLSQYDSGKTNFILRYVNNTYNSMTLRTIGMDYSIKRVTLNDGKTAKIQIWDTASGERSKNMITNQLRMMNGFIIMYNITEKKSFETAKNWLEDIRIHVNSNNINNIAFVGNHVDVDENNDYYYKREISTEEGQQFAEDNNLLFFETSNLTGFNVNECFNALINRIYENDPNKNKLENNIEIKFKQNRPGKRGCLK